MALTYINDIPTQKATIGTFAGINENEVINENEFSDMKNMSSDFYPAAGPRRKRGKPVARLKKPNGIHYNNGWIWIDGTDFFYSGQKVGTVADSRKQMVNMGAYVVIWPDKRVYNTNSGEWKSVEKTWTQTGKATIAPTITGSTFLKISCTEIGNGFSQGDGVEISGCSEAALNKTAVIQSRTDNEIVIIGALEKEITQDSGLTVKRKAPDMDFLTEAENRIWGCSGKNHEVYASKLGDPLNWNCFEGISTDSYAATIGSDGEFTGAVTHLGYVLFFKEHMIHKVFGNKPSNIQINSYPARGVMNGASDSLAIVNETLMYMSQEGVCAYDGGMPYLISKELRNDGAGASAGPYRGKYYLSIKRRSSDRTALYAYDTAKGIWHKEDEESLSFACGGDGCLYFCNGEGEIRNIEGEGVENEWMIESGDQVDGSLDKKRLHQLQFMMDLERGAHVEIYLKYDREPQWRRLKTITAMNKQTFRISVRPRRCGFYRYKIVGNGDGRLYALGKSYVLGSGR